jgi:hypothetical protein
MADPPQGLVAEEWLSECPALGTGENGDRVTIR